MAQQKFTNNATSKLAGSLTNVATSLSVTATEGAKFPSLGAGEWFMVNLVKLVGGLPVIEIVKVTARATDTFTIVRAQESTLATTFSAGDVVDLRITAGTMDNTAQRGGDNTFTGANTFNGTTAHVGTTTVPTVAPGDNSTNAASTAHVQASYAKKGANSDITSLSGLTTALSVAQGGTGATAGPQACLNIGAVQQGTGVGQGTNTVKIGFGTSSGLKATVDTTDQGFFVFSSTNTSTGTATLGYGTTAMQNVTMTTCTASGLLSANNGLAVAGAATLMQGGAAVTLANTGYAMIGNQAGLNIVYDYSQIQARNNGAATVLTLNNSGGLVQVGAGGIATTGGLSVDGAAILKTTIQAQSANALKMQLMDSTTSRGYIAADSSNCFRTVNAANSLYTLSVDNSGNLTAAGNITANSDVTLKKNWRDLVPNFLDRMADVQHGVYERIDTGETQAGLSAQDVQAICPELVTANEHGILSLAYGQLGALIGVKMAQKMRRQQQEIDALKALVATLIEKVGKA